MKKIIIILITFLTVPVLSGTAGSGVSSSIFFNIENSSVSSYTQTSVEVPKGYYMGQNYPNPFNPVTNIYFSIPKNQNVRLTITDVLGKEVVKIIDGNINAGTYRADFNGTGLASGVYLYKLETADYSSVKKMTLVK